MPAIGIRGDSRRAHTITNPQGIYRIDHSLMESVVSGILFYERPRTENLVFVVLRRVTPEIYRSIITSPEFDERWVLSLIAPSIRPLGPNLVIPASARPPPAGVISFIDVLSAVIDHPAEGEATVPTRVFPFQLSQILLLAPKVSYGIGGI